METPEIFKKYDVTSGRFPFHAKGQDYIAKAMSIQQLSEYLAQPIGFILPIGEDYSLVRFNFITITSDDKDEPDIDMQKMLNKWLLRLLEKDGSPVSLQDVFDAQWDIEDMGRLLSLIVKKSFPEKDETEDKESQDSHQTTFYEIISILETCGVSKNEILKSYSAPYLLSIYPVLLQAKTAGAMFGGFGVSNSSTDKSETVYGGDKPPKQSEFADSFNF